MERLKPHILYKIMMIGFIIVLTGCAKFTTVRNDGSTVKHYMGYVKIVTPPTASPEEQYDVLDVATFGFRIQDGLGVGYFREHIEHIPLDCRLVVKVNNKQQLERVLETIIPIIKEGLCVTVLPQ